MQLNLRRQQIALRAFVFCVFSIAAFIGLEAAAADDTLDAYAGWYSANGGRHLTVLPGEKELSAVFFWRPSSPTSVGVVKKSEEGVPIFWQPVDTQPLNAKQAGDRVMSVSVVGVEFNKQCDMANAVGQYVSVKNPAMEISLRDGQLHCSIDWKNGAPKTNGWLRAAANGQTNLQGFQWQETVQLEFGDNSIKSISLVGQKFIRTAEAPAVD